MKSIKKLLEYAFLAGGFTTRSDIARENAELVAEACQKGLITTDTPGPDGGYANVWRLTALGNVNLDWRKSSVH